MKNCGRKSEFQKTVPGFFFDSSGKKNLSERETPNRPNCLFEFYSYLFRKAEQ